MTDDRESESESESEADPIREQHEFDRETADLLWPHAQRTRAQDAEPSRDLYPEKTEIANALWPKATTPFPTDEIGFRYTQLERAINSRASELRSELNWTTSDQRAALQDLVDIKTSTGLYDSVVAKIAGLYLDGELASARRQRAEAPDVS